MECREFESRVGEALRSNDVNLVKQLAIYGGSVACAVLISPYLTRYALYAILIVGIIWGWILVDGYLNSRKVAKNKYIVLNDRAFVFRDKKKGEDVVIPYAHLELYRVIRENEEVTEIHLRYYRSHKIKLKWFEDMDALHDALAKRVPSNHR